MNKDETRLMPFPACCPSRIPSSVNTCGPHSPLHLKPAGVTRAEKTPSMKAHFVQDTDFFTMFTSLSIFFFISSYYFFSFLVSQDISCVTSPTSDPFSLHFLTDIQQSQEGAHIPQAFKNYHILCSHLTYCR